MENDIVENEVRRELGNFLPRRSTKTDSVKKNNNNNNMTVKRSCRAF